MRFLKLPFKTSLAAVILCGAMVGVAQKPEPAGTEMKKLAGALAGQWLIVEKDEPTSRQGETARGEEEWQVLPGGMPLMEKFHAKFATGDQYDSALVWWDAKTAKFRGIWCAAFNQQGCTAFDVNWQGDAIVMTGEYLQDGKPMFWSETFTPGTDAFTQTLDMGESLGKLKRVATIHATRAKK